MTISLLAYLATFSRQLYFRRSYFFTFFKLLRHNSYSFGESISSEQLLFFNKLRFRKIHFTTAVIFSECLIFMNETSTEQPLCENRKFFRAVPFQNSYFSGGVIAQNKDIYKRAPLIEARNSAQHQLFQKRYIFEKPTFAGELTFQSGCFFKKRHLLQQQHFQKSYFLTAYFFRRVAISLLRFLSSATLTIYQFVIK